MRHPQKGGFALVIALSLMAFVLLLLLSISTLVRVESQGAAIASAQMEAEQAALLGLNIALGELQKTAGPDQRVTATASVLGSSSNPYTSGTTAVDGRRHWLGVWDTRGYSPADPDNKTFVRWLVSGDQDELNEIADVGSGPAADDVVIFESVAASGTRTPANDVLVEKVSITNRSTAGESAYAYWVEDEGVKADLSWNEGSFSDTDREQAARLSASPGVDHGVFDGPFASVVTYPIEKGSAYIENLEKAFSPADMPLVMEDTADHSAWRKANRHNIGMHSRGVIADVKNGGLRRDLSLAFEMDGTEDSEDAVRFNQQAGEFVGNGDHLSSPYTTPGTSLNARYLFRDYGPGSSLGASGAGKAFSEDITQPLTTVRGPSWWLLRDYANLYKRLKTSGSGHSMSVRAYYPNRSVTEDLVELHSSVGSKKIIAANRETNDAQSVYAYRPVRASYAPVLLGLNAIFSLVYKNDQLNMLVDPFFIIWNPYNTHITADKFAVSWEKGFHGGLLFQHTDPAGNKKIYGKLDTKFKNKNDSKSIGGSQTSFADYAARKTSAGSSSKMSYLINGLTMGPGEVMVYSPDPTKRGNNANELHDELFPGLNYTLSSGIKFDEFPDATGANWAAVTVPGAESADHEIKALFNLLTNKAYWNTANLIVASLPEPSTDADELTTKANLGDSLSAWEFYTSSLGSRPSPNLNKGSDAYEASYQFNELSTKRSFAMITMLTQSSDYVDPDEVHPNPKMEVFSQLNVTPILRTRMERLKQQPLNLFVKAQAAAGIDNLMTNVGIDLDAWGNGNNGFYGKNYALGEGATSFPLLDIPKGPMHSLVQLSGANIGTRLFQPTHAIGNSWKPPYIPQDSIYLNSATFYNSSNVLTMNDVSWQVNDALFDQYYLSGIAPAFTINSGGYALSDAANASEGIRNSLNRFYARDSDYKTANANAALEPYIPAGKTPDAIVDALLETSLDGANNRAPGYKKIAAYSLIKGAFNVNSTSVPAWAAILKGNKGLRLKTVQGSTDAGTGTPFPLASTTSDTSSIYGWEKFSRLSDEQIWNDQGTPNDLTDDTGLAVEIVKQVKARGPFMSLSDFINRRIAEDTTANAEDTDPRAYHGAIQDAIEQAGINGDQSTGIRAGTSELIPNYEAFTSYWTKTHPTWYNQHNDFPYADDSNMGNRNCATGIPLEVNQMNVLLPLAPKLTARTDSFKIRAYGEVRDANGKIITTAICEAVVQRIPEYVDPNTDSGNNEPWDAAETATLNSINQIYGRRFEIRSFRWLAL